MSAEYMIPSTDVKELLIKVQHEATLKVARDYVHLAEFSDWPDDCGVDFDEIADKALAEYDQEGGV